MQCVEALTKFVAPNSQKPPLFAMPVTVFTRDLYLRAVKNYMGQTMVLEKAKGQMVQQAENEEAHHQMPLAQF